MAKQDELSQMLKKSFGSNKKQEETGKTVEEKPNKNQVIKKTLSYYMDVEVNDLIDRVVYWERFKNRSEALEYIIKKFAKDGMFKEVPEREI
jgi:uncharacterized protein YabN with tetrapyrrole methylase and pyrophosphatase domain